MLAIFISVAAGLVLEMFFLVIRYRDDLNKVAPQPIYNGYDVRYMPLYQPFGYMSVVDFLSGGQRKWWLYFLFRFFPPFVVLTLLAGVMERYFHVSIVLPFLLIAATVSLLPRDISMLFKTRYISEKLIHSANIVGVYILVVVISLISGGIGLGFVAPSPEGLFDNLWSSLFVASIVIMYSYITNPGHRDRDASAELTARDNYVFNSYQQIKDKYSGVIETAAIDYRCSKPILYAVLIYENMNRPKWMRRFENFVVGLTRSELTIGIAQVKSDKVLSDEESIVKAARILENSDTIDSGFGTGYIDTQRLEKILEKYNSSALYAESIFEILIILRQYSRGVFPAEIDGAPFGR